jgi:hypothetical protein
MYFYTHVLLYSFTFILISQYPCTSAWPSLSVQLRALARTLDGTILGTSDRLHTFVADSADPAALPHFSGLQVSHSLHTTNVCFS